MPDAEKDYFSTYKVSDVYLHSPSVLFPNKIEMIRDVGLIGEPNQLRGARCYIDQPRRWSSHEYKELLKSEVMIKGQIDNNYPLRFFDNFTLFTFALGLCFPKSRLSFGLSTFGVIEREPHSYGSEISTFVADGNEMAWIDQEKEADLIKVYECLLSRLWIDDETRDHRVAGLVLHSTLALERIIFDQPHFMKCSLGHIFPIKNQQIISTCTTIEGLLKPKNIKNAWKKSIKIWNDENSFQISEDTILYIKYSRDTFLHFETDTALTRLSELRDKLGFLNDEKAESQFVYCKIPMLIKEMAREYFCTNAKISE